MNITKFDQWLWRCTGVLLTLACIAVLAIASVIALRFVREKLEIHRAYEIVNVTEEVRSRDKFTLGGAQRVQQTPFLVFPLYGEQDYRQAAFSKSTTSTRNYLFFDTRDGSSHWLVKNNDSMFPSVHQLYEQPQQDGGRDIYSRSDKAKVVAFLYEQIKSDSNHDQRLTEEDQRALLFYNVAQRTAKPVVEDIGTLLGVEQVSDARALVLYTKGGSNYALDLDIPSGKVGLSRALAAYPER